MTNSSVIDNSLYAFVVVTVLSIFGSVSSSHLVRIFFVSTVEMVLVSFSLFPPYS